MKPKQDFMILPMAVLMVCALMPFSYGEDEDFISVSPVQQTDAGKAVESGKVEKQPAAVKQAVQTPTVEAKKQETAAADNPVLAAGRIEKILSVDLKDKVQVRIITSGPVKFKSSELAPPPDTRVLVQLLDCGVKGETMAVNKGGVSRVRSAGHGTTAWVVIDLKEKQKWDITQDGNTISINIQKAGSKAAPSRDENTVPKQEKNVTGSMMYRVIDVAGKNIDNKTRVIVTTDGPAKYRIKKDSGNKTLTVSMVNAVSIWQKEQLTLEDSAVDKISVKETADKTVEVKISLNENTPYVVNHDQNQIVIDIDRGPGSTKKISRKLDLNQKISLNVQEASLTAVLRLLSAQSGFEFGTGPSASRVVSVTLREDNQTLDTVLKDLLTPQSLYYEVEGNIIHVGDVGELKTAKSMKPKVRRFYMPRTMKAEDLNALLTTTLSKEPLIDSAIQVDKSQGTSRLLIVGVESDVSKVMDMIRSMDAGSGDDYAAGSEGGVQTKIFKLQYINPSAIQTKIKTFISADGIVETDDRSSSLIVTDNARNLKKVEKIIKKLDVKIRQVLIEAKLYEIDVTASKELGINWSAGTKSNNPSVNASVSALPSDNVGTLAVGLLQNGLSISATLEALESNNKASVLSSPKIAVGDNQTAHIQTSRTVYYKQTAVEIPSSGTTVNTTTFVPINLPIDLNVSAKITLDNSIIMDVTVSVASLLGTASGTEPPPSTTQMAKTVITTANNETVVIGGLITEKIALDESKVPVLGDLPLIGGLFRSTNDTKDKVELVVFLTPSLIEE